MRGFARVLSFDVISKAILAGLGIALIRFVPASEYAAYTLALAMCAFVTGSISGSLNRLYLITSEKGNPRETSAALGVQLLLISLVAILGLPLTVTLGVNYALVVALVVGTCATEFAKTCHQRDLAFTHYSLIELTRSALFAAAVGLLIWHHGSDLTASSVLAVQVLSLALVASVALKSVLSATSIRFAASKAYAQRFVRFKYLDFFAYFFLIGLFSQADIFMLKALGDDQMLATYGSAFRYYGVLSLALTSAHAVLLPALRHAEDAQALAGLLASHRRLVIGFGILCGAAAWAGFWVIPWVDTGRYPEAPTTFAVLSASAFISFAFSPYVNLLMRRQAFRFLLWLVAIALPLNLVISAALIPQLGALGAAISLLTSSAFITGLIFRKSRGLTGTLEPTHP